jgi:hypothetical protein
VLFRSESGLFAEILRLIDELRPASLLP